MALWAGRLAAPPRPVRVTAVRTPSGVALGGLSADTCGPGEVLVLLADPFSVPIDDMVAMLGQLDPPVVVVGGAASAARGPGGNRLVLDGEVRRRRRRSASCCPPPWPPRSSCPRAAAPSASR